MTPVSLLDIRHWHLSQFIVYGGQRNAAPAPGRLRAEQWSSPGKVSDAASHRHQPHQPQTPHSGKINALHSELWWQDNLYQEHMCLWNIFPILFLTIQVPEALSPPSVHCTAGSCRVSWWLTRLQLHMSHVSDRDHTPPSCQHSHSQRVKVMGLKFNAGFMKGHFAYLTTGKFKNIN